MAIDVIYQKREFGAFEKNSQRSIFVDEKHFEEIETKVEYKLGSVLQETLGFVSRFERLSKELKLAEEIKTPEDFFKAQYLRDPDYNFHEKALQLQKLLNILLADFLSNVLAVIRKIEERRPKSEAEGNLEIAKIKRLEAIAGRLTGGDFKILEPRMKSWTELGFSNREDFLKNETYIKLLASHEKELIAFRKRVKSKVKEFEDTIGDSEEAIKELRKVSEEIIKGEESARKDGFAISKRLGFLALSNADSNKRTVIFKESVLEDEILRLLNEFDESKRLLEQKYASSTASRANLSDYDNNEFRIKMLEKISWLRRAMLNLFELYVKEITECVNSEAVLELEEIQILAKVQTYLHILSELSPLFREIFQIGPFIEKLRGLSISVSLYSRESLKWEMHSEEELRWLSEELRKMDYLFSAHEDLNRVANPEKLIDIIPREVRIQGAAGTIISGDLYLKDANYRPKVGIIALHGVNDSRRVYYSLAARAANMGFLVYCPDLPSHGHPSEGTFKFGAASESMLLVIRHLKENYGVEKTGVIAWSLGSMVALFELMHYTAAIEDHLEKFDNAINEIKNNYMEAEARRKELRALIISEYEKYGDCRIDAMLLLTPVDHIQIAVKLKRIQELMGKKFPLFVDVLFFLTYRNFLKEPAESMKDVDNPPGTRFYFKKNPWVRGVRDSDKTGSFYKRLMDRFKLSRIEDPIKARALKIWKPEELKYSLVAPSQIVYFNLLLELCPEIIAEIRKVPKVAIFGEDDSLLGMRKRGDDLIKLFEGFGNMKTIVLKEMGHDLDYNGDGHNLYIDPVLIKHFYGFFLLVAQQ